MQNFAVLLRTVLLVALVGLGGWWTLFLRNQFLSHERELGERDSKIEGLTDDLKAREQRIDQLDDQVESQALEITRLEADLENARARIRELELAMWLLKVHHRVARVDVLDQGPSDTDPNQIITKVRFVELGHAGEEAGPVREIEIQGKVLYLEGLVIKFEDDYVEGADALRGSSVAIFKRVFSENQAPSEGTAIDRPRMHPLPYRDDDVGDPFYEDLWERFWDYANDPDLAASKGVRAMHGEAPSIELRPGKSYRVELRASGGLSIQAED